MAGFAVTKVDEVPPGMSVRGIPEGDYAVFEHQGALDTLGATYDQIYREWLPASEYEVDPRDDFELYDDRFDYGKAESIMEIWIPIKKKAL
jgi:AraC family transcriptional regulator